MRLFSNVNRLFWLFLGLLTGCQPVPAPLTTYTLIGADAPESSTPKPTGCGFRYTLANRYPRLSDASQRAAIRTGFDSWASRCPNLRLLDVDNPASTDLLVQFVAPGSGTFPTILPADGLVRTRTSAVSALKRNANGSYTVLLDETYGWTVASLAKAIAYQAGRFLGLPTATDQRSAMSPVYAGGATTPTPADSVQLNRLFASPCRDLTVSYLPMTLPVSGPVTRTIRTDRSGPLLVTASGFITVGPFVGLSPPEGVEKGVLGFPVDFLTQYSIDGSMRNGCLMYRLNADQTWRYCGAACTIELGNARYTDLTFNINDRDLSNNSGAYTVTVREQ